MPPSRPSLRRRLPWGRRSEEQTPVATEPAQQPARSPALSVVMPIYNVEEYLDACIASVLDQSFTDLELILVDDGSTDGSAAIAQSWEHRDERVRLISQPNSGLGAARNTATAAAHGEFLAYADSDDLVLPGAYLLMVRTLRSTGSDFVVGSFIRGEDESATYTPEWVARVHARRLTAVTVTDHPEMVRDITAWNKVFRRSFWDAHELTFPEGVRYEDQVIITKAMLLSTGFDVLDKPVYFWRTRNDGSSITQTKGSLVDLRDRLRSLHDSRALVTELGTEAVQDAWFAKWLGFDFLGYFERALSAEEEYWTELRATLAELLADLRPAVLTDVPLYPRLMCWLLTHDRRDAAEDLFVFNERSHYYFGWPTAPSADDLLHAKVPVPEDALPPEVTRVNPADIQARCRLLQARWEGTTLVLRGVALLTYVDVSAGPRQLRVSLRDDQDAVVETTVTVLSGDEFDHGSQRRYEDHSDSGFEARVDALALIGPQDGPTRHWRVELHQGFGEVLRDGGFERVSRLGTSAARVPIVVEDREVRLLASASDVVEIQINRHWSQITAAEDLPGGRLRLTVRGPVGDPVQRLFHLDDGERTTVAPVSRTAEDIVVEVGATPVRTRLYGRHDSKGRSQTTLAEQLDAVPAQGPFLHARPARAAFLGPITTTVLLDRLGPVDDGIRFTGTCLTTAAGASFRLQLAGERVLSEPSAEFGAGPFEVTVPVLSDPWGLGRLPLPADEYVLELVGDREADVLLSGARRADPPARFDVGGSTWIPGGGENRLLFTAIANAPADRGARRQEVLRERYAEQRHQELLPAVLFECFYGRTVGDSPLAILRELVARDTGLDLVWGVKDWSVPVPEGARAVLHSSAEWYELLARARYVVSSNNFPYYFTKTPGQVFLQTWHGTPLKKIGHDIVGEATVSRAYLRMMDASAAEWDYLVSPSRYCSEIFPGAFAYDGPILEVGYPRNDVLVAPDRDDRRAEVRSRLGISDDRRVVLYAPTWRDEVKVANRPHKQLYLDAEELCRQAPDVTVLVRGHANTAHAPSVSTGNGPVRDVTLYPDIADLYLAADVLVTDYSSVMFDFVLTDRPIYLLTPDLASYRDDSRGFYLDLEEWAPGPVLMHEEELVAALVSGAPDTWADARARFRERFCPLDDGHAAARVVDAVFGP